MAKRRTTFKRMNADEVWKALSDHQRNWFCTVIVLIQAVGNERVLKRRLPAPLRKMLRSLDLLTMYRVITECVNLLAHGRVPERGKKDDRAAEAKKKKRSSGGKRASAANKKSRAKKSPRPSGAN